MYGDEGIKLLLRSRGRSSRLDTLPQYEDERVSKVVNEISYLASDTENIVAAAQRLGREGEGGGDGSGTPGRDDDDEEEVKCILVLSAEFEDLVLFLIKMGERKGGRLGERQREEEVFLNSYPPSFSPRCRTSI